MKFKKKEKETVKEPKKTPPPRPGGKGAPSRSSKPKRESGNPPSSTPTKSESKRPSGPVDRGNSPLADVKGTPAYMAKRTGMHNTAGFIGSDGKRYGKK
jgi:hypothetical protein